MCLFSFCSTFVYTKIQIIFGEVLNRNTLCSYVLPESVADVLLAEEFMFDEGTQTQVFHKISERICKRTTLATTT